MCVGEALALLAAVPIGIDDETPPFWLTRLFGSGRQKRKTSRDIGTCITERQLLLETPPISPASALRSPALPDLIACCNSPSDTASASASSSTTGSPECASGRVVFVFPDVQERLSGTAESVASVRSPSLRQAPSSSSSSAASVQLPSSMPALASPLRSNPTNSSGRLINPSVRTSLEVREAASALRLCANQLEQRHNHNHTHNQLNLNHNHNQITDTSSSRKPSHLLATATCCVVCVAVAGCMYRRVFGSSN